MPTVDGAEVLRFCKTLGLLVVEATTCPPVWITAFVASGLLRREPVVLLTLTAGGVKTVAGLLCDVLEGVCIGALTSVTVGTLLVDC